MKTGIVTYKKEHGWCLVCVTPTMGIGKTVGGLSFVSRLPLTSYETRYKVLRVPEEIL